MPKKFTKCKNQFSAQIRFTLHCYLFIYLFLWECKFSAHLVKSNKTEQQHKVFYFEGHCWNFLCIPTLICLVGHISNFHTTFFSPLFLFLLWRNGKTSPGLFLICLWFRPPTPSSPLPGPKETEETFCVEKLCTFLLVPLD